MSVSCGLIELIKFEALKLVIHQELIDAVDSDDFAGLSYYEDSFARVPFKVFRVIDEENLVILSLVISSQYSNGQISQVAEQLRRDIGSEFMVLNRKEYFLFFWDYSL